MLLKIAWWVMTVLALAVAAYASAVLLVPGIRPEFARGLFAEVPQLAAAHLAGGAIALAIGAFQLNARLRARWLGAHRWMGRLYVIAVMVGACASFALALRSTGGLVTHFGFGLLAICWIGSTLNAWRLIRNGHQAAHREWMMRSYALTLAAVTLRIYIPASQIAGMPFESAYQAIAWMSWVPNLLVVEWFLLARRPRMHVTA